MPFRNEPSGKPSLAEEPPEAGNGKVDFRAKNTLESFGFALAGLQYIVRTQRNFRTHLAISGLVVTVGLALGLSATAWAILTLTIGLMLGLEILNTAIELTIDLYTEGKFHPLARIIKDISAGACLIGAVLSVIVGLFIFLPALLEYLAQQAP